MTTEKTITLRELHLELYEVGETITPAYYVELLVHAFKNKSITLTQFTNLYNDFEIYCNKYKVELNLFY